MPIVNNGTTMTTIMNNGTAIQTVIYNGTTVFTAGPVTADPTVGTPFCHNQENDFGIRENYVKVNITNNDTSTVTVYINNISNGTLGAGATGTYQIAGRVSVPYSYNITVYTQATGKSASQATTRSGSITICQLM